jgi:hypothetical protein
MTHEQYKSLVDKIDALMTECRAVIPEKYTGDKMMIFQTLRETSHWVRDAFELAQLELEQEKLQERFRVSRQKEKQNGNEKRGDSFKA